MWCLKVQILFFFLKKNINLNWIFFSSVTIS